MLLSEYLNKEKLNEYIQDGIVSERKHPDPECPLVIYCYTKKATYNNIWDDVTCRTRGLIVDKTNDVIVARPFEKFFNLNTFGRDETYIMGDKIGEVSEKLDGSLGIYYNYGKWFGVATKGSFSSDHAIWATAWLNNHINTVNSGKKYNGGFTLLFEIICESVQQHVVTYDFKERLVLIGIVDTNTGNECTEFGISLIAS